VNNVMSVKSADRDYDTALEAWSAHLELCEICGSVESDGTLEEALPELCAEGRRSAEAEIAADAVAVRIRAGGESVDNPATPDGGEGFRSVPAQELEPGMVTDDGQEILDVEWIEGGGVLYHVFTPSDDEAVNQERNAAPEARGAAVGQLVAVTPEEGGDPDTGGNASGEVFVTGMEKSEGGTADTMLQFQTMSVWAGDRPPATGTGELMPFVWVDINGEHEDGTPDTMSLRLNQQSAEQLRDAIAEVLVIAAGSWQR
jgi:hypothetical protein